MKETPYTEADVPCLKSVNLYL